MYPVYCIHVLMNFRFPIVLKKLIMKTNYSLFHHHDNICLFFKSCDVTQFMYTACYAVFCNYFVFTLEN